MPHEDFRCWVSTVSLDHVEGAIAGGFTQTDHGRDTRLRRLRPGDRIVYYSPRLSYPDGATLQCFTAIAVVTGAEVYQVEMTPTFHPWRLEVEFERGLHRVPARDLVESLSFVPDPQRWGYPFRRGLFEVPREDFDRIATAMRA